jgi:hypothetical protein
LEQASEAFAMRVATIFGYLVGRRRAILEIASDPSALAVGGLLVVSAAIARNYDRVSLRAEPWRLLGPFAASLAISIALFAAVFSFARWKGMHGLSFCAGYRAFLALYWMTAPLAWLYGIPYERFLSRPAAVEANLWTLALVSIWRVALMVRAVSVIFGLRVRVALPIVMTVADVAALVALYVVPLPILNVMGGIPEENTIAIFALLVTGLCWVTLPVWLFGAGLAARRQKDRAEWCVAPAIQHHRVPRGGLVFAAMCVAVWMALLPFTQRALALARHVDETYRQAGAEPAIALMSAHARRDFPPDWQPPPKRYPGSVTAGELLDALETLIEQPHARWVEDAYAERFLDRARLDWYEYPGPDLFLRTHAIRLAKILPRLRAGPTIARSLQFDTNWLDDWVPTDTRLSLEEIRAIRVLQRLAGVEPKELPRNPFAVD